MLNFYILILYFYILTYNDPGINHSKNNIFKTVEIEVFQKFMISSEKTKFKHKP